MTGYRVRWPVQAVVGAVFGQVVHHSRVNPEADVDQQCEHIGLCSVNTSVFRGMRMKVSLTGSTPGTSIFCLCTLPLSTRCCRSAMM